MLVMGFALTLYNPHIPPTTGFLTAVLQNHARKMAISVDSLTFRFQILPEKVETAEADDKGEKKTEESDVNGDEKKEVVSDDERCSSRSSSIKEAYLAVSKYLLSFDKIICFCMGSLLAFLGVLHTNSPSPLQNSLLHSSSTVAPAKTLGLLV